MNDVALKVSLEEVLNRTYSGKRIFITGHNGFVGSWLTFILQSAGAQVTGFSLAPVKGGFAEVLNLDQMCHSIVGDIRELSALDNALQRYTPEIVFHLAAQPLVLPSFKDPLGTLSTNVIGTANVLEAVRHQPSVQSCIVITSDKCYATGTGAHEESDPFGGDDLYSASKGAAEIVVHAYRHSFFQSTGLPLASARAGNIVGGGDWADYRIVPDSIRAIHDGEPVRLRQPSAIRPWQHVLDAVAGYLRLGDALMTSGTEAAEGWNFGPHPDATVTVAELVNTLVAHWRTLGGDAKDPIFDTEKNLPERQFLSLISTKSESRLGWNPHLDFNSTMAWTAEWYLNARSHDAATFVTQSQIDRYLALDIAANTSQTSSR